ncbi:MAG: DUF2177 family protein [Methylibium sp.]|uniref:DUF2177 family protein n=1 Tax=Methylibium sp. TaxID=2067992 RepID=UPI0018550C80|nr:DUF2177 family protein [Methylibium sp.]MBA3596337.1 DUF2177 family protein [Methylibium sp.]
MSRRTLIAYFSTAAFFLVADLLWLGVLMAPTYHAELGSLLLEQPNWLPAGLFYAAYVVGIVVFAVLPGLESGGWLRTARLGALLGLLAYAAYDLTNLATLRGWPVGLSVIDMTWGTLLTASAATVGYFATRAFAQTRNA